ncbi:MAG: hypothetical protein IJZ57_11360 [Clostridia bacterium]|nr:hypothetical protein [Clostridia bacterium]
MKKILLLLIACAMLLLCACDEDTPKVEEDQNKSTSQSSAPSEESTTVPSQRIEHIAEKLENGMLENLDEYNEEEKEQIKSAVEKDGYTLEFKDDGSGVLSNEEGEWTVAAGWVENEYTEGIPVIDFGTVTMSMEDEDSKGNYYMFLIRQANFLEVENYVETLGQIGYTDVISKVVNQSANAVVFEAQNSNGKRIELGYSSNGFTFKIYK